MTEQEILEAKLIAKFLEITVCDFYWRNDHSVAYGDDPTDYWNVHYFVPNKDWNILMPAVEKIESIENNDYGSFRFHIVNNYCTLHATKFYPKTQDTAVSSLVVLSTICEDKRESTYRCIVNFIKWYNEKNK